MTRTLTEIQAFRALVKYLTNYPGSLDGQSEVGAVISEWELLDDGKPADPAAWSDWQTAVDYAIKTLPSATRQVGDTTLNGVIDEKRAYRAAYIFMERYVHKSSVEKIRTILSDSAIGADGYPIKEEVGKAWQAAVANADRIHINRQWRYKVSDS